MIETERGGDSDRAEQW